MNWSTAGSNSSCSVWRDDGRCASFFRRDLRTDTKLKHVGLLCSRACLFSSCRRALLARYGSLDKMRDAPLDELATVQGMSKEAAKRLKESL